MAQQVYQQLSFAQKKRNDVETLIGRNLPANIDAERSVLASLLLNGDNVTLVADLLKPSDFYYKAHESIYETILALAQANQKIDLVIVQDHLETRGVLEEIGGIVYLLELQENIPAIGLISQHAKIVKDKAILRELISSASTIIETCYDNKIDEIDTVLDSAEKRIYQIANNLAAPTFVQLDILLKKAFQHLALVKGQRQGVTGISTGFHDFDTMTSGMQRGDLLILAARPSMGKTAFALNIAVNAWYAGAPVGIFSLEMSAEQLVMRMLSSEAAIPHQKIRNAMVTSDEWMELTNHAAKLAESKIFIDDTPGLTIMELRAKARKLKARENIQFLVIDYLQLITGSAKYENRTQEIAAISRSLKSLAKELNIPILALSQLSRSLESRIDKRPMLSDLRESGAIEQDGDVIFFIYRDIVYNPDTEDPDLAEIIIGKQRNGPVGSFNVKFRGDITKFHDVNE